MDDGNNVIEITEDDEDDGVSELDQDEVEDMQALMHRDEDKALKRPAPPDSAQVCKLNILFPDIKAPKKQKTVSPPPSQAQSPKLGVTSPVVDNFILINVLGYGNCNTYSWTSSNICITSFYTS